MTTESQTETQAAPAHTDTDTRAERAAIPAAAGLSYRIDSFHVPAAARGEFEAAMRRNMGFLTTLPGYVQHLVFEKAGGPTAFNVVTVATWASREAHERAAARVRAYYAEIGFDAAALMARLGITGEIGDFVAPVALQTGSAS